MERNQRGESSPGLPLVGYFIGMLVANVISVANSSDSSEQARQAQVYNAQIEQQLSHSFTHVEDLIVNPDSNSFNFGTQGKTAVAEVCEGHFTVTHDTTDIAGKIACTQKVSVQK